MRLYELKAIFGLSQNGEELEPEIWQVFEHNNIERGTIVDAIGYWESKKEKSKILIIYEDLETGLEYLDYLARVWNQVAGQDCVLVSYQKANMSFISGREQK